MSVIQETLYLQRGTKSDAITPESVTKNPATALAQLVEGFHWLHAGVIDNPYGRNYYASSQNQWRRGRFGYVVTLVLPLAIRQELHDVILVTDTLEAQEISVADVPPENKVYSTCYLPEARGNELLPYAVVFGGLVHSDEPFKGLHIGKHVEAFMENVFIKSEEFA